MFPMIWPQQAPNIYVLPEANIASDIGQLLTSSQSLLLILVPGIVGYFVAAEEKKFSGTAIGLAAGVALALFRMSRFG
jgi:hypothetical protein